MRTLRGWCTSRLWRDIGDRYHRHPVRRAFGATSNPTRAQNAHATSVVDITAIPYVAHCARHQIPPRAPNAHADFIFAPKNAQY
ncbi:hypothetical protein [Idiomarina baltica]|uniref:hypothetical protein n=1 Tax=Idiomarina baltica TaxID=190892 RepID=UPI002FDD5008